MEEFALASMQIELDQLREALDGERERSDKLGQSNNEALSRIEELEAEMEEAESRTLLEMVSCRRSKREAEEYALELEYELSSLRDVELQYKLASEAFSLDLRSAEVAKETADHRAQELEQQIEKALSDNQVCKIKIVDLSEQLHQSWRMCEAAEQKCLTLTKDLQGLDAAEAGMASAMRAKANAERRTAQVELELAATREAKVKADDTIESLGRELGQLRETMDSVLLTNDLMARGNAVLEAELTAMKATSDTIQSQNEHLNNKLMEVISEVRNLTSERANSLLEIEALKTEILNLKSEQEVLVEAKDVIAQELASTQTQLDSMHMFTSNSAMAREIEALRKQLEVKAEALRAAERRAREATALAEERTKGVKSQVGADLVRELELERNRLADAERLLREEVSLLQRDALLAATQWQETHSAKVCELEATIRSLGDALAAKEGELSTHEAQMQQLQAQNEKLQKQMDIAALSTSMPANGTRGCLDVAVSVHDDSNSGTSKGVSVVRDVPPAASTSDHASSTTRQVALDISSDETLAEVHEQQHNEEQWFHESVPVDQGAVVEAHAQVEVEVAQAQARAVEAEAEMRTLRSRLENSESIRREMQRSVEELQRRCDDLDLQRRREAAAAARNTPLSSPSSSSLATSSASFSSSPTSSSSASPTTSSSFSFFSGRSMTSPTSSTGSSSSSMAQVSAQQLRQEVAHRQAAEANLREAEALLGALKGERNDLILKVALFYPPLPHPPSTTMPGSTSPPFPLTSPLSHSHFLPQPLNS